MNDTTIFFIFNSLVIFGIHAVTRDGQLLWPLAKWIYNKIPLTNGGQGVVKALIDCPPCMASTYGTIGFFLLVYPALGLWWLPGWVLSLCGFNYLLNKL